MFLNILDDYLIKKYTDTKKILYNAFVLKTSSTQEDIMYS